MFQKIVVSALIAGFGAGIVHALLQFVFIQPLLIHAELFELGPLPGLDAVTVPRGVIDPLYEALNVVFAVLVYTGYALVLLAVMSFAEERGHTITARNGLIWGIAGFVTMHLAPAFGLAPDMPGLNAAPVEPRQVWWFGTAAATGIGLWLIAFGRNWAMWGAAIILIAAPHIIGAPLPLMLSNIAPPELAANFAARTLGLALVVWTTLGLLLGAVWNSKFSEV
jgi:cobalt transporter subunit CbtA